MDPSTLAGASTATCGAANILRVPLLEKKEKINQILGERQVAYWRLVEMFLRAQLSKQELDDQMTQIFGVEKLHYHNDLILALLHNARAEYPPPKVSRKRAAKKSVKVPLKNYFGNPNIIPQVSARGSTTNDTGSTSQTTIPGEQHRLQAHSNILEARHKRIQDGRRPAPAAKPSQVMARSSSPNFGAVGI